MLDLINPVSLSTEEDSWGWRPEGGAVFTVNSTYRTVYALSASDILVVPLHAVIFTSIWKCPAPSKVSGFVWQLLHGRIPTRSNLLSRHVIDSDGDSSCVLCGEELETELHLFIYCEIAMLVWLEVFAWLQIPLVLPHNLFSIFNCLLDVGNRKVRKGMIMICCAVVWILWRCRNSILFDNDRSAVDELVEAVKVTSWKWWIGEPSPSTCLFYEWRSEPRLCLLR
ncbi:unnamed protein product [Trifolium pratense]|uniref:Uncharacterized protein n=1 Tax=Trifolium pratense TaxID=57577 RepID=A0ACB0MCN9_TRIPR|nr:unnamed protein product [Trifolium pratense]